MWNRIKNQGEIWSNLLLSLELGACIAFLYKVVHKIDRFPNYCLATSNGAWPVAKGRAIASFPCILSLYGRVGKRQWEDGQEGEERRLWQSERLGECFPTKGIFEAAKTSHQRKQILLGVERKLSVAQRMRSLRRWSPSLLVSFPCSSKSKFMLRLVVSVNMVNNKDYTVSVSVALPSTLKFVLCQEASAKKENRTVTAQPCRCTDVPKSETQSIGTKCVCVRERERERERERDRERGGERERERERLGEGEEEMEI